MKKLILLSLLFFSSLVHAQTYFEFSVSGPGYRGIIIDGYQQYNQDYYRHNHRRYYRSYVEPPRMPDPYYKPREYYRERNSCFPYPIYDYRGVVIGHQIRCM